MKFQTSGTTFGVALALFCHHRETAIVTEFSSNDSNTVFTAKALEKYCFLSLFSFSSLTFYVVLIKAFLSTCWAQIRCWRLYEGYFASGGLWSYIYRLKCSFPLLHKFCWQTESHRDFERPFRCSDGCPIQPERRVPGIGPDLEEEKDAGEDDHRVGKEVVRPVIIISLGIIIFCDLFGNDFFLHYFDISTSYPASNWWRQGDRKQRQKLPPAWGES